MDHSNIMNNVVLCANLVHLAHEDNYLLVLPLFHVFAMVVVMNAGIYKGTRMVLVPRFEGPTVLGQMEKHEVTVFAGVPTMFWGLLNTDTSGFDLDKITSNLRVCLSGGASLPVEVLKDFESKYNVPILEGYGMSEGSPVVTFNHLGEERIPGSIGKPVWGVEVMIADENDKPLPPGEKGQLLYRGHNVMKGYYKKPEANKETLKGGWLHFWRCSNYG